MRILHSSVCSLWKKWKKTCTFIDKTAYSSISQKQSVHPKILFQWQKLCVKCHQHQFTVVLKNWIFRRYHWDEFYIKTFPIYFRFVKCAGDRFTDDAHYCKKNFFSDEAPFDLGEYIIKQSCRIWGTENSHTYIEKPMHPKRVTVWTRFWSRGIIGTFFFENYQGMAPLQSMAIVIGLCWTNFCSQKLKRRILASFGFNRMALRATQKLHLMFCDLFLKMALLELRFDTVGLLLVGVAKEKCYADRPETINALKDNIREAIGKI